MNQRALVPIWGAFCTSQLLFAAVGVYTWPGAQPENAVTIWVLAAMTAPMTLLSVFGADRIAGGGPAQTRSILKWAFAESVAVFGIVASFLGGPRWLGPAMAAWAFLLVLIAYPREEG